MRRREFIAVVGGAAATWPLAVSGQQADQIRRIGLLMIIPEGDPQSRADRDALGLALHALGWIAGRNVDLDIAGAMVMRLCCVNTPRNWLACRPTCS
jgi:putative ABC transport system substrate-binding protein